MDTLTISVAGEQHQKELLAMWQELTAYLPRHHSQPFGIASPDYLQQQLSQTLDSCIERDDAQVFIASTTELVGTVAAILNPQKGYSEPSSSVIFNLWVKPESRNQGVAQALLSVAKNWLKEQNVTSVQAGWHPQNSAAERFWKQQGFGAYETIGALKLDEC